MAQKPESKDETNRPSRGKGKASVLVDAAATEVVVTPEVAQVEAASSEAAAVVDAAPEVARVTETVAESPIETVAEPAPVEVAAVEPPAAVLTPTPVQPSKLMPALIGLVAGAIGGIAGYQIMEFSRPKSLPGESPLVSRVVALEQRIAAAKPGDAGSVPPVLVERLEKVESLLANAGKGGDFLREELGKLGAALKTEVGERKKALEGLAQPGPALGLMSKEAGADLEGLKSRLGSVEGLQPKLDSVTKDVQALAGQLSTLAGRDTLGAANARLAAVSLLEEAVAKGRPLASSLDLLKGLGAEAGSLAALVPFATSGLPDAKKLLEQLKGLVPPPVAPASVNSQSLVDRVKQGALSLVEVRKTGETTGRTDDAALARAGQALQRGEIAAAVAEISKLSGDAAARYAPWRAKVEARAKALEALGALKNDALATLAKAAQPAK
ncbi:MAG: hypothetical protein CFE31_14215 [Rhizobiales bacterium PAR1]|nr:MAG: hypothetical protein CFE31_14215 [Rhizobiales bacterium PAR1]